MYLMVSRKLYKCMLVCCLQLHVKGERWGSFKDGRLFLPASHYIRSAFIVKVCYISVKLNSFIILWENWTRQVLETFSYQFVIIDLRGRIFFHKGRIIIPSVFTFIKYCRKDGSFCMKREVQSVINIHPTPWSWVSNSVDKYTSFILY